MKYTYTWITSTREKFTKLVEGNSHYTISVVESLFYAISVMNVNVYVQNTVVVPILLDYDKRMSYFSNSKIPNTISLI